jgi:UDP-N-acetylmuramate: L-alanyl-gamma-D-glutamyl-meso-diaminopimelate ligase
MKIHILGICGTAMASIAGMLRESGHDVRGSDTGIYPPMSLFLQGMNIQIFDGYKKANLDWKPDIVVVGNVIRKTNEEASAVRDAGIEQISMPQALSRFFLQDKHSVVIAGTHGKTTTSSLVAHLLHSCGCDPSFMIGGIPLNFNSNYRLGRGKYFVLEGDEYDTAYFDKGSKFFHYRPQTAIINNIEFDHADIFPDLGKIVEVFRKFAGIIPPDGCLLVPEYDENAGKILEDLQCIIIKFGVHQGNYCADNITFDEKGMHFTLLKNLMPVEIFSAPLWGNHNLHNAVGALSLCMELGISPSLLKNGLASFKNVKKRQEILAEIDNIVVMDDFAHHPTAVRETLKSVKIRYPSRRIIALFEPESNTSRRRVFQEEYVKAFSEADIVLFTTPLEKKDNLAPEQKIDMEKLVNDIKANGRICEMIPDVDRLANHACSIAKQYDVIVGMSGRDFKDIHAKIIQKLQLTHA